MKKFNQLDTEVFEKYFGGFDRARSVGIFIKMANLFLESFDKNFSEVRNYLQKNEFSQAQIVAHRLKGALRTVGGTALGDSYYEIEKRCGEQVPADEVLQLLEATEAPSKVLRAELKVWMNQLHSSLNGTYFEQNIKG